MALLEINDLTIAFGTGAGAVRAVDGLSLAVQPGEILGLVGESGSGKTVTALAIARLLPSPPARYVGGRIVLDGHEVLRLPPKALRALRGGTVSYVFQEPAASLNPVLRVDRQIREALRGHRPEAATREEVVRLLKLVGIPAPDARRRDYPHQLSGGMQQRVMIAMALAPQPKLLVADEPTTALDVTIQAQILALLRELRDRLGMSLLLISHNLGLVGELADRVAVMYAGQIAEMGPAAEVLRRPLHPYTLGLLSSVPRLGSEQRRLTAIPGVVPSLHALPTGCRFHPRCALARPECAVTAPALRALEAGRKARCPYSEELE